MLQGQRAMTKKEYAKEQSGILRNTEHVTIQLEINERVVRQSLERLLETRTKIKKQENNYQKDTSMQGFHI